MVSRPSAQSFHTSCSSTDRLASRSAKNGLLATVRLVTGASSAAGKYGIRPLDTGEGITPDLSSSRDRTVSRSAMSGTPVRFKCIARAALTRSASSSETIGYAMPGQLLTVVESASVGEAGTSRQQQRQQRMRHRVASGGWVSEVSLSGLVLLEPAPYSPVQLVALSARQRLLAFGGDGPDPNLTEQGADAASVTAATPASTQHRDLFGVPQSWPQPPCLLEQRAVCTEAYAAFTAGSGGEKQLLDPHPSRALRALVREHGVCPGRRSTLWMAWSGAAAMQEQRPDGYAALCARADVAALAAAAIEPTNSAERLADDGVGGRPGLGRPDAAAEAARALAFEQIETDLNRTSSHPWFGRLSTGAGAGAEEAEAAGVGCVRRLLRCFVLDNPTHGYTQSLNFLAAFVLLVAFQADSCRPGGARAAEVEERAFWLLSALALRSLRGYHTAELHGVRVDTAVFDALVSAKLPQLAAHLDNLDVASLDFLSSRWLLCCFAGVLPTEAAARVFDQLLLARHNGPAVLLRVGLAILHRAAPRLLEVHRPTELLQALSDVTRGVGRSAADIDILFHAAWSAVGRLPAVRALRAGVAAEQPTAALQAWARGREPPPATAAAAPSSLRKRKQREGAQAEAKAAAAAAAAAPPPQDAAAATRRRRGRGEIYSAQPPSLRSWAAVLSC
jgi:hypothetical protein